MAAKARADDAPVQASFVFQGTVLKTKATTMPAEVPATDRTVVARVDQVIRGADALADFAGHEVTVELAEGAEVRVGQTAIFHTVGWVFGDSMAVRAVRQEDATVAGVAAMAVMPDDPAGTLRAKAATDQAATADLIVSGRVEAVQLPPGQAVARGAVGLAAGTAATGRISEHDPLWQEAVIHIDSVHHGKHAGKRVVVRFPASTDVRWHAAPKFHAGQEGVFLLHKDQFDRPAVARMSLAPETTPAAGDFTALSPADVLPLDQLPQILAAIGGANPG